jgi:hypothetical protein
MTWSASSSSPNLLRASSYWGLCAKSALGDGRLRVSVWDATPYIPAPFDELPGAKPRPAPVDAVYVGGFKIQEDGSDGGRHLFVSKVDARLYSSLPGAEERIFYER